MGHFWLKSPPDKPLLFIARGTGCAPIKAMIEQQMEFEPQRKIVLFWGVTDTSDFFRLEKLEEWMQKDSNMSIVLSARNISEVFKPPAKIIFIQGTVYDTLRENHSDFHDWHVYLAVLTKTVRAVLDVLQEKDIPEQNIFVDAFGG